ncbi:hypothetical protein AWB66_01800 [Caballeronia telluris]|uniref:Pectate lyase superfamily protein n=1 Tax=Caballeronia telluris TaxID=326475 RepID=A0A158GFE0_9BURK|nr:hypothetical protein AWB66_01800 [Caballeronia telluris]
MRIHLLKSLYSSILPSRSSQSTGLLSVGLALAFSVTLSACGGDSGASDAVDSTVKATKAAATSTQPFTAPTLVNPINPQQYGAKCDGVTDDSKAFQSAVNAGDVKVPASKTCLINKTVNITTSYRHIECAAGAVIKQTNPYAGNVFRVFSPSGASLSGDSIVNCTFVGANSVAPKYYNNDDRHWNIAVQTGDRVSNFLLAGNTFKQFFGQTAFQTYGTVDGGSGDRVEYNTFQSCGYYGPAFVAHRNGYMGHNKLIDCAMGVENDNASQNTGGNVIEYNTLTAVHGYGAPDMNNSVMLTGGVAGNANYSTNIVRNNTVSGVSDSAAFQRAGLPSAIWQRATAGAAQYQNNTCSSGCQTYR